MNAESPQLKSRNLLFFLIIAVCIAVGATHWPSLTAQATCYDDEQYFIKNFLVRNPSWQSASRFISEVFEPSTVTGYYQPLTMISLMLDHAMGQESGDLTVFHRTSLILHIANTALMIVLLYQLFGHVWIAVGVGLLFGVHPLTVEPVVWIGERKTLLAAFFALCSLIFYIHFARRRDWRAYLGCFVMYVLALCSKPTSTLLPVVMLLMDYWPLKRLQRRSVLEKLPLFIIGGISAVITYISQSRTLSVITPDSYGFTRVPLVICHNIIFYLYKMIWPVNLSAFYPFPDPFGISTPVLLIGVIGTFILIGLLVLSLRRTPAALISFFVFFAMVLPTMQVFKFSDVIAADKFVYLPSIGILMILSSFLIWLCISKIRTAAAVVFILVLAGGESLAARNYLAYWKDSVTLFTYMVDATPNATSPRNVLAVLFAQKGDINRAVEHLNEVLKLKPDDVDAHLDIGKILADQHRYDEAMVHYNRVLDMGRNQADIYSNIALVLADEGRFDEAVNMYRRGLELKVRNPYMLHSGLGVLLMRQGKMDEAITELQIAAEQRPDPATLNNLAGVLILKGRLSEAIECYINAIKLDLNNAKAYCKLANILFSQGNIESAIGGYERALDINPKYIEAHLNLALALARLGRLQQAGDEYRQVLQLEPNNAAAIQGLKNIQAKQ